MKRIFLLLAFAGTFAAAKAQSTFGAKAGLNVANIGGKDVHNNKARIAFHGGLYGNFSLADKLSIQPELVYSLQGVTFDYIGDDSKTRLNYLNIPVMFQYEIAEGFYAQAGPQFGFLLSAKNKLGSVTKDIKNDRKKFDLGLGLGAGYKFPKSPLGIDARYIFGLSKLDENNDLKRYNRVLQIGLFYQLGKLK
ncbi:PorT family protein [Pseudoflavitalea sp. G-6-1-2]|uniref:porin family protein n=1 Tax=Pseudoflavitalea sp. G-6-1-2 TaxID=2728841 RepID=UPI00146AC775|nr:porin family protein [Pseudoflavitalea sp. G-6-1-2]NML23617.1 PorT family protein [Pseudoflavitalea sp. G-6-1-2]